MSDKKTENPKTDSQFSEHPRESLSLVAEALATRERLNELAKERKHLVGHLAETTSKALAHAILVPADERDEYARMLDELIEPVFGQRCWLCGRNHS